VVTAPRPIVVRAHQQSAVPTLRRCSGEPCGCDEDHEHAVRRSATDPAPAAASRAVPDASRSSGGPLDASIRVPIKPRFSYDFSRIHATEGAVMASPAGAGPVMAPRLVHDVLNSPGVPLDSGDRAFMEARFAHDFSQVRVHADPRAAASAAVVGARAYTLGHDIVFSAGAYTPHTTAGRRLLAHELTHTMQQRSTALRIAPAGLHIGDAGDATEYEAEQVADWVMRDSTPGSLVSVSPQSAPGQPAAVATADHDFSGVPVCHVRQRESPTTVRRQACGHDGPPPQCGGYRWGLVTIATGEETVEDLDYRIVEQGLRGHFGGTWATEVQTPPNRVKLGRIGGRADGLKVSSAGALRVEVVEVKSRSTWLHGGCARATREATEYVRLLNGLGPQVVAISQVLSAQPDLRQLNAVRRRTLAAAGIDLSQERVRQAWIFFLSLEDKLGRRFDQPFTSFQAALNTDGAPGTDYWAGLPVLVNCKVGGKRGVKVRQLMFQVNGAGGVSYGCTDTRCRVEQGEEQEKEMQVELPEAEQVQVAAQPELVGSPVLTNLFPELTMFRSAVAQGLNEKFKTAPVGTNYLVIAPREFYIRFVGEPRMERQLELMRVHGLDPRRNPLIGYHNLWVTLVGIFAALEAIVVIAPFAFEVIGAAAEAAAAEGAVVGGAEVISLSAYQAARAAAMSTAARTIGKAAGVLLVVWVGSRSGEARAFTTKEIQAVMAVPSTEVLTVGGAAPGLGVDVTYRGEPYVIVGAAQVPVSRPPLSAR
jgi:hypothetical protein